MVEVEIRELGSLVLVFLGTWGSQGVLQRSRDGQWKFHPPGSLAWDSFHQEIYRNYKGDALTQADLDSRGISLPDLEGYLAQNQAREWKDNFKAQAALADVPKELLPHLKQHFGETLDAYVVLLEDHYETSFGDGKFLYPEAASWTRTEAEKYIKTKISSEPDPAKREWYRYSIKMVLLRVDKTAQQVSADLNIESYEHYSIDDVLRLLSSYYRKKP
jgi:hypothetical protein